MAGVRPPSRSPAAPRLLLLFLLLFQSPAASAAPPAPCGPGCHCLDRLLSCVGTPGRRLELIPLVRVHNHTFFSLDFQSNSISTIQKSAWFFYSWAESLSLKDNVLKHIYKDAFEGLLLLKFLDLSCNKIEKVEPHAFEPLPFLQSVNLAGNFIHQIYSGTFEAWHELQFLTFLVLGHNPVAVFNDNALFNLASLTYLDVGATNIPVPTIQTIMMTPPRLEKLILPYSIACCLCLAKTRIELHCNTVKLHCTAACDMNNPPCQNNKVLPLEENTFRKSLEAHRKNRTVILHIEPEAPLGQSEEEQELTDCDKLRRPLVQVNFNEEVHFVRGEKDLFPGNMSYDKKMDRLKTNGSRSFQMKMAEKIEMNKLTILDNLLEMGIQGGFKIQQRKLSAGQSMRGKDTTKCGDGCKWHTEESSRSIKDSKQKKVESNVVAWEEIEMPVSVQKESVTICHGKQCQSRSRESTVDKKRKSKHQRRAIEKDSVQRVLRGSAFISTNNTFLAKTTALYGSTTGETLEPPHHLPTADSKEIDMTPQIPVTLEVRSNEVIKGRRRSLPSSLHYSTLSVQDQGNLYEIELNTQLESLIPNRVVRAIICHIIRVLMLDCLKPDLKLSCAELVASTGRLMKLFSEREHGQEGGAWRKYMKSSTTPLKGKCPGYGNKLLLAISVTVVIMVIILVICFVEICYQRSASHPDVEGKDLGFFQKTTQSLLTGKKPAEEKPEIRSQRSTSHPDGEGKGLGFLQKTTKSLLTGKKPTEEKPEIRSQRSTSHPDGEGKGLGFLQKTTKSLLTGKKPAEEKPEIRSQRSASHPDGEGKALGFFQRTTKSLHTGKKPAEEMPEDICRPPDSAQKKNVLQGKDEVETSEEEDIFDSQDYKQPEGFSISCMYGSIVEEEKAEAMKLKKSGEE
ncbi:leucine-rich repeat-containing protein 37A2-like isoform X2 [Ascaphus truei]|uniref:leucine-rich repeat-containing protein 37A2-like isoform X2 n=1 Tax=Ascaphus truei TaxID=8439 RepID=UPI003F59E629